MATVATMSGTDGETAEADAGGNPRRCIVTRAAQPREGLVRFVVGPDGTVVPDIAERLPGRGLWLTARRDIVQTACGKGAFARAARRPVTVPDGLDRQVEGLLARRCIELIGLARRAGLVTAGYEKVRAALADGRAALVLAPSDTTGRDGEELAVRVARAADKGATRRAVLTRSELGAALGREDAVHVALAPASLTERVDRELSRLTGFRLDPEVAAETTTNETRDDAARTGRGQG